MERARKKAAKELEKKRAAAANAKPVVTAQLVPKRAAALDIEESCGFDTAARNASGAATCASGNWSEERHRAHLRRRYQSGSG